MQNILSGFDSSNLHTDDEYVYNFISKAYSYFLQSNNDDIQYVQLFGMVYKINIFLCFALLGIFSNNISIETSDAPYTHSNLNGVMLTSRQFARASM